MCESMDYIFDVVMIFVLTTIGAAMVFAMVLVLLATIKDEREND